MAGEADWLGWHSTGEQARRPKHTALFCTNWPTVHLGHLVSAPEKLSLAAGFVGCRPWLAVAQFSTVRVGSAGSAVQQICKLVLLLALCRYLRKRQASVRASLQPAFTQWAHWTRACAHSRRHQQQAALSAWRELLNLQLQLCSKVTRSATCWICAAKRPAISCGLFGCLTTKLTVVIVTTCKTMSGFLLRLWCWLLPFTGAEGAAAWCAVR